MKDAFAGGPVQDIVVVNEIPSDEPSFWGWAVGISATVIAGIILEIFRRRNAKRG